MDRDVGRARPPAASPAGPIARGTRPADSGSDRGDPPDSLHRSRRRGPRAPGSRRYVRKHDPEGRVETLGEGLYRPTGEIEAERRGASNPGFVEYARRNWTQYSQALWARGTVFNGDYGVTTVICRESRARASSPRSPGRSIEGRPYFESLSPRWGTRYRDQQPIPGFHRIGGNTLDAGTRIRTAQPEIRVWSRLARSRRGPCRPFRTSPSYAATRSWSSPKKERRRLFAGGSIADLERLRRDCGSRPTRRRRAGSSFCAASGHTAA